MQPIFDAMLFLNWERNLAADLRMSHGAMKDLTRRGIIKYGMNVEQAQEALKKNKG